MRSPGITSNLPPQHRVRRWLEGRTSLLLVAHERPDGDAYGSLFGLHLALRAMHKRSFVYLGSPLPERYARILPLGDGVVVGTADGLPEFEGIVCLDVTSWQRTEHPWPASSPPGAPPVCLIDHHPDSGDFAGLSWQDPTRAATAQMLTMLLRDWACAVPPAAATALLVGLVMDTGGFRFPNTNADVLRDAAFLIECGADLARTMHALFMCESYAKRVLEATLLQTACFAGDGRLIFATLTDATLREHGLTDADTEGLIDTLKAVDGVCMACLLRVEQSRVRFSLRAHNEEYRVDGIARELGGGGHRLAAGATVAGITGPQAQKLLIELAEGMIRT